jgi:hypothetical protein
MTQVKYSKQLEQEEIDLVETGRKIVLIIQAHRALFLFSLIAGLLGGLLAYYLLPPAYKTSMIADSRVLGSPEIISMVDSWDNLLRKKEYEALATKLKLSSSILTKVKSLEAELNNKSLSGSDPNNGPFVINAVVTDNSILDTLEQAIVSNIQSNEYVKRRINRELRNLDSLKKQIEYQIADLNEVKTSVRKLLQPGERVTTNAFVADPGSISVQILSLFAQKQGIEDRIQFIDEIQVIDGFTKYNKPDSPKRLVCLALGAALGLLLSTLIVGVKVFKKRITQ